MVVIGIVIIVCIFVVWFEMYHGYADMRRMERMGMYREEQYLIVLGPDTFEEDIRMHRPGWQKRLDRAVYLIGLMHDEGRMDDRTYANWARVFSRLR